MATINSDWCSGVWEGRVLELNTRGLDQILDNGMAENGKGKR